MQKGVTINEIKIKNKNQWHVINNHELQRNSSINEENENMKAIEK